MQTLSLENNISYFQLTEGILHATSYLFIAHIFVACGIVFGNALVIISVYKNQCLRTVPNVFVVNLAVADLLTVLCAIPAKWITYYAKENFPFCYFVSAISYLPQKSSLVFMTYIALDRLFSIQAPFLYERYTTPKNVLVVTIVGWISANMMSGWVVVARPVIVDHSCNFGKAFSATFGIVCSSLYVSFGIIIFTAYMIIGETARRQAHKIAAQNLNRDACATAGNDTKIRKMMLIVVGTFYICWTPFIVIAVLVFSVGFQSAWLLVLMEFAETLVFTNSLLNPIIYAWRSHPFRTAFRDLLNMKRDTTHTW